MWKRCRRWRYNRQIVRVLWLLCLSSLLWLWNIGPVHAATMVNISGTIRATPRCVLNNNETIRVGFGNTLRTEEIDGSKYKQPVKFTMDCKNLQSNTVKLQLKGAGAEYNTSALQTSISGLGLGFSVAGAPVGINTWFDVDHRNVQLEVVPVKVLSAALPDGNFDARATLLVSFP